LLKNNLLQSVVKICWKDYLHFSIKKLHSHEHFLFSLFSPSEKNIFKFKAIYSCSNYNHQYIFIRKMKNSWLDPVFLPKLQVIFKKMCHFNICNELVTKTKKITLSLMEFQISLTSMANINWTFLFHQKLSEFSLVFEQKKLSYLVKVF